MASYNIENFTDAEGDGPDRTVDRRDEQARGAASLLDRIDADVVVFMEVENGGILGVLNQRLARPFPVGYATYFENAEGRPEKLNLGVMSRLALESVDELDFGRLQGPGKPTRGVLRVLIHLDEGRKLAVYAVHLKSNYGHRPRNMAKRRHAMQLVMDDALKLAVSQPGIQWEMLVVGDMNVDPELPEFARDPSLDPARDWLDLWRGRPQLERATVPTRVGDPAREFPPACFDRIVASPALGEAPWRAGSPQVLQEGVSPLTSSIPGVDGHISDHFPVWVDLTR